MNEKMIKQIKINLSNESTEQLLEIWTENDSEEWSDEAFEAIKRILNDRNIRPSHQKQIEEKPEPFVTKQDRITIKFVMESGLNINFPSICACCNRQTSDEFETIDHTENLGSQLITRSIQIPMCSDCQNHNAFWNFVSWSIYLSPLLFFVLGVSVNQYLFFMIIGGPVLGSLVKMILSKRWRKKHPYHADCRNQARFNKSWNGLTWVFKNKTFADLFVSMNEGHLVEPKPPFKNK